jgi:phosphotriesterase-related protein
MPTVETVNGPLDVEELGLTLIHEHFRATDEAGRAQFPHLYDEQGEWAAAMADASAVKAHGVKTVVEPSAMFLTRDAAFSKRVAHASGLNVILATGVYTYDYLPQVLLNRDEDAIAAIFVHEIENGIQGTGIKPAFIKCAADAPGVTPTIEKLHRAAARASRQTGRPIMAHSRPANATGLEQMRIFEEEGVDPAKIQIAHTGDTDELDTSTGSSTPAVGSGWTDMDSTYSCPQTVATRPSSLCWRTAAPTECSCRRTTARRSTGFRSRSRSI